VALPGGREALALREWGGCGAGAGRSFRCVGIMGVAPVVKQIGVNPPSNAKTSYGTAQCLGWVFVYEVGRKLSPLIYTDKSEAKNQLFD
jgi:hypothetical protein